MKGFRMLLHGFFNNKDKLTGGYRRWKAKNLPCAFHRVRCVERINDTDDVTKAHALFVL